MNIDVSNPSIPVAGTSTINSGAGPTLFLFLDEMPT